MPNEEELTAEQFLDYAENLLEETKKFKAIYVSIPMSEEEFNRTFKALEDIRRLGKLRNISVKIESAKDSWEEYAHTYSFKVQTIESDK